jgi:dynein heavy chain
MEFTELGYFTTVLSAEYLSNTMLAEFKNGGKNLNNISHDTAIDLINKVKATGLVPDRTNCWEYFINQIRRNLHVVLAFSPVGDAFRTRARKFPAIVNCTVIDWFQPWPIQALASVGKKLLAPVDLGSPDVVKAIEHYMPTAFMAVNKMCKSFAAAESNRASTKVGRGR